MKCTISIGRAIGGMGFVHCTEVVRFSESPLLEVSLYSIVSLSIVPLSLSLSFNTQ